jgi:phosphonate transport system substrate-binding protein
MRPTQLRLIVAFLTTCLLLCNSAYADEIQQKEARINMGFYLSSISEVANRSDIEISLNFWAKDLFEIEARKQNFAISSSSAVLFDRIEDMKKEFELGKLDLIVAPPLLISRYFKREELSDGFVGMLEGKKPEGLLLIARTDRNINSVKDLYNKRLLIIKNDELADIFIDTLVLKELHQSYKNIGLSIQRQQKSNRIVLDVFFNKADAGVIYSSSYDIMTELNPDIKNKTTILAEYPIKSKNFSYFRKDYPLIDQLTKAAMAFPDNPRARQILEVFKTPDIDYCKVEELDSFDKFYKSYLQLKLHVKK